MRGETSRRAFDVTLSGLERDWNLTIGGQLESNGATFLAEAITASGESVVLKVGTTASADGRREAEVLRRAAGKGYARVLAHDTARQALLLERLGARLDRLELPYERQVNALCATLLDAWMPLPADADFPTGAQQAGALASGIVGRWKGLGEPCPTALVERALLYCRERATAFQRGTAILAHGDPRPAKLLALPGTTEQRFKFIAPKGLAVEPAYDLGIILAAWDEGLGSRHAHDIARSHARHLGSRTQVSAEAIWQWGFVVRLSNALLLRERGDTDDARAALRIAEALNRF